VIIRYADVLLMAAELGSSNAQSYYDQVRQRAGLSVRPVSQANIMEERRFEFALKVSATGIFFARGWIRRQRLLPRHKA
jgi:hypothetical protein